MEETKFLDVFASIFDDVERDELAIESEFKEFEEWSSLTALGLLAVMEDEYGVNLTHNDIKNSRTVGDIFNIVNQR